MVGEQSDDTIVVSEQGITVSKRLDEDDYSVPTIEFTFESERSDRAMIQVIDEIPEALDSTDFSFPSDQDERYWRIENENVVIEYDIAPGESYTTLCEIGNQDAKLDRFLENPVIADIVRSEEEEKAALSEEIPNIDSPQDSSIAVPSPEGSKNSIKLSLPEEAGEASPDAEPQQNVADADEPVNSIAQTDGSIVETLVDELNHRDDNNGNLATLQRTLALSTGSIDTRVTQLQTELAKLQAYTDAMEQFLDENGSGEDLIQNMSTQLTNIENDVNELQEQTANRDAQHESLDQTLEEVRTDVTEKDASLEDATASIEELEGKMDELAEDIPEKEINATITEVQRELEEFQEWQDQVQAVFGGRFEASGDEN